MLGLMGRKIGMTQHYNEKGDAVPVTLIEVGPCTVTQIKTAEKEGYTAIQLGFGEKRDKNLTKAQVGHFKKNGLKSSRWLKEFRVPDPSAHTIGQTLGADFFEVGKRVDVIGTTMGRGFQGVVKRHRFKGGPMSHGTKTKDQPGSIGASAFPSRVIKGKRLPGHMGTARFSAKNLVVVAVDTDQNIVAVRGPVPGKSKGLVVIRPSKDDAARLAAGKK
jgi:large subunit ribosomal protein L3